jgi:hypothetical protein
VAGQAPHELPRRDVPQAQELLELVEGRAPAGAQLGGLDGDRLHGSSWGRVIGGPSPPSRGGNEDSDHLGSLGPRRGMSNAGPPGSI